MPIHQHPSGLPSRLPELVSRLLNAGTSGHPLSERGYLVAANATGYLAAISSLCYATSYAIQDFANLKTLVYGNILSALITGSIPLFHRFGPAAAGLVLTATIFSTIFYFIAVLGRDAGIQLNYLAASAIAFLVLGIGRLKLIVLIVCIAAVMHLAAWFLFPQGQLSSHLPPYFLSQTYVFSALSMTAIISLVVYYAFQLVRREQARSNDLLLNILPLAIAERLKSEPDETIAERHEATSVLFADICGFTPLTGRLAPEELISLLDDLFSAFDHAAARLGVEKIKTIGDAYMIVSGVPDARPDHAAAAAELALAMLGIARQIAAKSGHDLTVRIGIASGPLTAGVIGRSKFAYDVWGSTVNRAARLEASGHPEDITIDDQTRDALGEEYLTTPCGEVDLKGIGPTQAWFLTGRASKSGNPDHGTGEQRGKSS